MSFFQRIFGERRQRKAVAPLYDAIVELARDPGWYREGGVPDTLDGRFDMVAAVTALVLLRLDALGEEGRGASVLLTELFIDDMDATLRQMGIGDHVVGKHVGRMMGALGGRLVAFRAARETGMQEAVRRNVFHEAPPSERAVIGIARRLQELAQGLDELSLPALLEGTLP